MTPYESCCPQKHINKSQVNLITIVLDITVFKVFSLLGLLTPLSGLFVLTHAASGAS